VILLGAGGAARAIVTAMVKEKASKITIVNRTMENAIKLAEFAEKIGGNVETVSLQEANKLIADYKFIINSTSIDKVNVLGKHIKETYKNIHIKKKGLILKENSQIFDLIKNNINNNDYLMIKGSNSTGLHSLVDSLKKGYMYAL